MKLSQLLHARDSLVQRANLANLAFAYQVLADFSARVARARLTGTVTLQSADPESDRYWATLTTDAFNQSVIEEHFSEEDLTELSDAIAYLAAADEVNLHTRIEEIADNYLPPLRALLERAGIEIDGASPPVRASSERDAA